MSVRDQLEALLEPLVSDLGYEFVGLEYLSNPKNRVLRIYIDRPDSGVGVEDCAEVSREVSALLDVEDPISGHYSLEVSSPGVERPLFGPAQFERFAGERAVVHLHGMIDGRRKFTGIIVGADADQVVLAVGGIETALPMAQIRRAHLKPDLDSLLAGAGDGRAG